MKVRALMTQDTIHVSPQEMTSVAARLLSRCNIGAMPICKEDGRLQGMMTDRDIVTRCIAADKDPNRTPVSEIMTSKIVSIAPDADVEQAAELMASEQIRRLPVVENEKLVGMLSLGDLSVNRELRMEASACLSEICHNIKRR